MRHLTMQAMALEMPHVAGHPNALPFTGTLCQLNVASTRPPSGANGHRVRISTTVAQRALPSLLGQGVDMTCDLQEHDRRFKIGVVTEAWCQGNDLRIRGHFYARDFPDEIAAIQRQKAQLGFSYEVTAVETANVHAPVWDLTRLTFCGCAVILKSLAAYQETSIAARAATGTDYDGIMTELRQRGQALRRRGI